MVKHRPSSNTLVPKGCVIKLEKFSLLLSVCFQWLTDQYRNFNCIEALCPCSVSQARPFIVGRGRERAWSSLDFSFIASSQVHLHQWVWLYHAYKRCFCSKRPQLTSLSMSYVTNQQKSQTSETSRLCKSDHCPRPFPHKQI